MSRFKVGSSFWNNILHFYSVQPPLPSPAAKLPLLMPLPDDLDAKVHLREIVEAGCGEAKLIGVMSAFLQVKSFVKH